MTYIAITTCRNAAITAARLFRGVVNDKTERCQVCGELLHPFPEPKTWMEYPLPYCLEVDGIRVCDDSRKPSCVKKYLTKHPTPLYRIEPHRFHRKMESNDLIADAQRVRKEADYGELMAKLADWPPSTETGYREGSASPTWESPFLGRKQPTDPMKLREKLEGFLESARENLAADCERYDAIRTHGLSEISDYDIFLSGWTQSLATDQAWRAISSAIHLKHNHITYHRTLVRSLMDKLDGLNEELGMAGRLDVPVGYELLDVELLPHQAFIARKWEAATLHRLGRKPAVQADANTARVRVLLPAHQAFQIKQWASQVTAKNVANSTEISDAELRICEGIMEDGRPMVELALTPVRDSEQAWVTGWEIRVRDTDDVYRPIEPQQNYYPFYRPLSTRSKDYRISCAAGAFGASVVLGQIKDELIPQSETAEAVAKVQELIRRRARDWNQLLLDLGEFRPFPRQKCLVMKSEWSNAKEDVMKVVIVTKVCDQTRTVFAYDDKPIRYRTNGRGRRIVEFDPSSIQTVYSWKSLRPQFD